MNIERRTIDILETREATDGAMEVSGIIVPYGERAQIAPDLWEEFERGAFGDLDGSSVTFRDEHRTTIGRSVQIIDTDDGPLGTFRISDTGPGREAYTLARDGAYRQMSVGFVPVVSRRDGDTIIRERATLVEVSLVGVPAYAGAAITEVRNDQITEEEITMDAAASDTTAEVVTNTEGIDEARELVAEARAIAAAITEGTTGAVTVQHRGHQYRNIGEVMVDAIALRRGTPEAAERLTRSIDLGIVERDGSAVNIRAWDPPGNSIGGGVAYDTYIPALLELLREGRPVADLFIGSPTLPAEGNKVFFPAVSQGNVVGVQDAQGSEVANQNQEQILTDFPKTTVAGGQALTVQSVQWTNPSYLTSVVQDLLAAYSEEVDRLTIVGDPAVDAPISGNSYTGILNAGATDVPVGGDHKAALALVGSAWAAVYAGSKRSPIAAMMNAADWGALLDLVDTDGRPLVTTDAPSNPAGIGNAASISGTMRGIPVVLDDNITAGNIILGSFRDAHLLEDTGTPAQISLTYPQTLTLDVSVYGFSALAIRRPAAFAVLSGIV